MLRKVSIVSRYLLGLIYLLSGAAGLFNLLPQPENLPENMLKFMEGMMAAQYFFPFLKGTEMITGLFLIIGIASPLMLLILAPISIHIFLVHSFLTPGIENLVVPILILILHGLASVNYWEIFKPLLRRK